MQTLSPIELQNWISLLHKDLLEKDILIGGYLFNLYNLNKMEVYYEKKVNSKLLNFVKTLNNIHLLPKALFMKVSAGANFEICAKRKDGTTVKFPCLREEYEEVLFQLRERYKAVQHFKEFCLNELQNTKEYTAFMDFIKDFYDDILTEISL